MRNFSEGEFGRIFRGGSRRKKPGFPGLRYRSGPGAARRGCFAPLQPLARSTGRRGQTTEGAVQFSAACGDASKINPDIRPAAIASGLKT
jgi:hypothetical protein